MNFEAECFEFCRSFIAKSLGRYLAQRSKRFVQQLTLTRGEDRLCHSKSFGFCREAMTGGSVWWGWGLAGPWGG
ncbi:hypothetical protein, partial [Streptomyces sp. AS58]|uniref:hypothetical protein n=1 Tax=Streptomyces sp. AS58 TaxID=1519489 RepID=UPI001F1DB086